MYIEWSGTHAGKCKKYTKRDKCAKDA